jgi:hypothetical protein
VRLEAAISDGASTAVANSDNEGGAAKMIQEEHGDDEAVGLQAEGQVEVQDSVSSVAPEVEPAGLRTEDRLLIELKAHANAVRKARKSHDMYHAKFDKTLLGYMARQKALRPAATDSELATEFGPIFLRTWREHIQEFQDAEEAYLDKELEVSKLWR